MDFYKNPHTACHCSIRYGRAMYTTEPILMYTSVRTNRKKT